MVCRHAPGSVLAILQRVVSSVVWWQETQTVLVLQHILGDAMEWKVVESQAMEVSGAELWV